MVKELFIVGGPSGSGKTFISKALSSFKGHRYCHFFKEVIMKGKEKNLNKTEILRFWYELVNDKIRTITKSEVWDTHFSFQKSAPPTIAFAKRSPDANFDFVSTLSLSNVKTILDSFTRVWVLIVFSSLEMRLNRMGKSNITDTKVFMTETLAEMTNFLKLISVVSNLRSNCEVLINILVNENSSKEDLLNNIMFRSLHLSDFFQLRKTKTI